MAGATPSPGGSGWIPPGAFPSWLQDGITAPGRVPPHGTSIEVGNRAAGRGEGLREQVIFPGTPGQHLLSSYLSSYMPSP